MQVHTLEQSGTLQGRSSNVARAHQLYTCAYVCTHAYVLHMHMHLQTLLSTNAVAEDFGDEELEGGRRVHTLCYPVHVHALCLCMHRSIV